jgi:hypothetical protein
MSATASTRRAARKATSTKGPTADALAKDPVVKALLGEPFLSAYSTAMKTMQWAEEEIEKATREHPDQADRLWHAFQLLTPTHDLMKTEFVYRSHCRELLGRVINAEDTRPGTAAECCAACCSTSELAPLTTSGTGLYMRMWAKAGFPDIGVEGEHYEVLKGREIDDHEALLRRKLTQKDRKLPRVIEHSRRCPESQAKAKRGSRNGTRRAKAEGA